jgi:hypothetical protein
MHAKGFEMHISLEPGARPCKARQYRLTPLERDALLSKVDDFIQRGWIEPSVSPWSSSVLFVPKPNGSLRFCVDFRFLNDKIIKDQGPIPSIPKILDSMGGACQFTALDLCSGFYQIPLAPDSRQYTAFLTLNGLYQWRVMPMGICNSPAVFQNAMNTVLRQHIAAGYCPVYLDDVLIMSANAEEHAHHLDSVLTSLKALDLFYQLPKCDFALPELRYLGHLVNGDGVKPDPKKVAALDKSVPLLDFVCELANPTTSSGHARMLKKGIAKTACSFLSFMQYFSRFIPRVSDMASNLYDQTKDEPDPWTDDSTRAWQNLVTCLSRATLMYHPDFSLPFHLYFDASIRGIGGAMHPVAFCARRLRPAEINHTTTEQEFLAMVFCFQSWRCYLEGLQVFAHTDHEPQTWLSSQKSLNHRQSRWMEYLSRFM